jgi:dipeptidyl aminopeptidase/acylaminoacyl peptidase
MHIICIEWEFGLPWSNINNNYDKWSPDACIVKWKTPMLVIHGGKDYRVSDTHGISTFTALQRKGIPSKFLHFPEEGHHVNNPNNLVVWYDTILSWLDEWLL